MHARRFFRLAVVPGLLIGLLLPHLGCARETAPVGSELLSSGHLVTATAPDDGTVYVSDKEGGQVLYSGRVKKGDTVSVNPEKGMIQLNGAMAEQRTLRLDHQFEIRFQSHP